ncbi:MAG TPA: PilZ domain-containing protein, partial [Anaeromyxobacter sp.]|nr:PilZ domain-containing protein [Anaeromyxobacter sp.]
MTADQRREPRVSAELRIRLSYGSVDDFVERYATNLSRGGIFVRTLEPTPPGSEVLIDISLATGDHV